MTSLQHGNRFERKRNPWRSLTQQDRNSPILSEERLDRSHQAIDSAERDTIRLTLASRRFDRCRNPYGIEVWKLMRELGDMNNSLNTVTGVSQRGFNQLAREQRIYVREKRKLAGQAVTD